MRSIEEVNQLLAAFNQCVEEGATRTISEKEADTLRVASILAHRPSFLP